MIKIKYKKIKKYHLRLGYVKSFLYISTVNELITKTKNKMNLKNKISVTEIGYIEQGKREYDFFCGDVENALLNNTFNEHFFFSSIPGYSKTWTLNKVAEKNGVKLVKFEGSLGLFAFCADVATLLMQAPDDDSKIFCLFDDCDSLFQKGDNLNTLKGMFDADRNVLKYGKQLGGQYHQLDDTQKAAIDGYRTEGKSGFKIPTDRLVFITLTNKWFPNADDAEKASDSKKDYYLDLAAIRRRTQFKEVNFEKGVDWGYCAHILMSSSLAEQWKPDITDEEKIEILRFTSPTNNWNKMTERNLSVFDKMVKDMVRFPDNYYDRWISQYIIK